MAYPVIGRCPVCSEPLEATRLYCPHCDTAVEGHFCLGRFHYLAPEQLLFAETFIRCAGKINRVEEELGISYPTVRGRLHDLIRALGYEVGEDTTLSSRQRREILARLAEGEIDSDEAFRLLKVKSA